MPRIPQTFLDDLLGRTDIVALIGGRIQLKKAGRDWQACCPFHNEKTPSFTVSPTKQFYHCFGCGSHGNALRFLMEYDRLEFLDAVEALAHMAGVEVPHEASSAKTADNKPLHALMEQAAKFYREQLRTNQKAVDYLKGRGLSGEIAKAFGVGYAPPGWNNLLDQLQDEKLAVACGMAIRKDDGSAYDRFRDRIMFPIRDTRGRVVAFGGRTLGDETPKYLNSPETPIFHKGRTLYGLYEARQALREIPRLLVVEGYMDVVALAQHDIVYAVATLGTATTEEHLEQLFRSTSEVVFCFDGDRAGREAGWRALERALPAMRDGREVRFLFLPEGEDPDTLVRQEGRAAFEERLKNALPLSRYLLEQLRGKTDLGSVDGRARLVELARAFVIKMPAGAFRKLLTGQVARLASMPVEDIEALYFGEAPRGRRTETPRAVPKATRGGLSLARRALQLLLEYPQLAADVAQVERLRGIEAEGAQMLAEVIEFLQHNPRLHAGALLEHWQGRADLGELVQAAGQDALVIPEAGAREEFQAAIGRLLAAADNPRIKTLLAQEGLSGLSAYETRELAALLQRRKRGKPPE
jgi:DNA primase